MSSKKTLTKIQLSELVTKETGLAKLPATWGISSIFEITMDALKKNTPVKLANFGVFSVTPVKPRKNQPAKDTVTFTPSEMLVRVIAQRQFLLKNSTPEQIVAQQNGWDEQLSSISVSPTKQKHDNTEGMLHKRDILDQMTMRSELDHTVSLDVFDIVVKNMVDHLANGHDVKITGFGYFSLSADGSIEFKPGAPAKTAVNNLDCQDAA